MLFKHKCNNSPRIQNISESLSKKIILQNVFNTTVHLLVSIRLKYTCSALKITFTGQQFGDNYSSEINECLWFTDILNDEVVLGSTDWTYSSATSYIWNKIIYIQLTMLEIAWQPEDTQIFLSKELSLCTLMMPGAMQGNVCSRRMMAYYIFLLPHLQ